VGNHLSELAEAEINELKNNGLTLTLDQMIWINDLARKVENPDGGKARAAIGEPIPAGGVWLYPFTIQSHIWYEKVLDWFVGSDKLSLFCMAYALAHSREHKAFDKLTEYSEIKKVIKIWGKSLDCTYAELLIAVNRIMASYDDEVPLEQDSNNDKDFVIEYDYLISKLCANVGQSPEFWLSDVSREYFFKQLQTLIRQEQANDDKPDINDPYVVAVRNLGRAIISIKQTNKADNE